MLQIGDRILHLCGWICGFPHFPDLAQSDLVLFLVSHIFLVKDGVNVLLPRESEVEETPNNINDTGFLVEESDGFSCWSAKVRRLGWDPAKPPLRLELRSY